MARAYQFFGARLWTVTYKQTAGNSSCSPCPHTSSEYSRTTCLSWANARTQCQGQGSNTDLVVILSSAKNVEVTAYLTSFTDWGTGCNGPYPWIGASGCASGKCTWIDGSAWSFTGPGFAVDSTHLHYYVDGRWGTHGGTNTAKGICERKIFTCPL